MALGDQLFYHQRTFMRTLLLRVSVLGGLLFVTYPAHAQVANRPFDPLRLPEQTLRCRVLSPDERPNHGLYSVALHFEEGEDMKNDRTLEAAFDLIGSPVILVVVANEPRSPLGPITHALTFRFSAVGQSAGFQVIKDLDPRSDTTRNSDHSSDGRPDPEPLSAAIVAQARVLAAWLWSHRCPVTADG